MPEEPNARKLFSFIQGMDEKDSSRPFFIAALAKYALNHHDEVGIELTFFYKGGKEEGLEMVTLINPENAEQKYSISAHNLTSVLGESDSLKFRNLTSAPHIHTPTHIEEKPIGRAADAAHVPGCY